MEGSIDGNSDTVGHGVADGCKVGLTVGQPQHEHSINSQLTLFIPKLSYETHSEDGIVPVRSVSINDKEFTR